MEVIKLIYTLLNNIIKHYSAGQFQPTLYTPPIHLPDFKFPSPYQIKVLSFYYNYIEMLFQWEAKILNKLYQTKKFSQLTDFNLTSVK